MGEFDFRARIPNIAELCSVVVEIDLKETQDSSAKSHFHWKTFKCRLILDIMGDSVIACPVYETPGSIHVITSSEFFKSHLFHENLSELNVTWSSPRPVTPDVYGNCLRYSILFAIAPRWNRVGQYLIAGRNFLTQTSENNLATNFRLAVQTTSKMETNAIVRIHPLKIRQCNLSLEDIDIPHEVIAHFMADPDGKIDVTLFGYHRATVLPSLKRGRLMTILKTMPANCPFKNYGELRRHWKNMYGYRLPKTDVGMIYYDVYFPMSEGSRFLYPHVCVRSRLIEIPYLGDRESLIRNFLKDVSETIPTICGQSFVIVKKDDEGNDEGNYGENKGPHKVDMTTEDSETAQETPKCNANVLAIHGKPEETTRLSFSARYSPKNRLQLRSLTQLSSLMSPTPSQRGNVSRDKLGASRSRGILTSSVKVCETKSTPLLSPRTIKTEDCPENQNCCPNAAGIEAPRAQEDKSMAMEVEHRIQSHALVPISNFASTSRAASEITPIFTPLKFQQESVSAMEKRNKSSRGNCEVVSKFFETQSGSNEATGHLTIADSKVSNTRKETTLLQKVQRNMKPKQTWNRVANFTDDA